MTALTTSEFRLQRPVVLTGLAILTAGAVLLGSDGWRYAALLVIGGLLGMSLYHAAFGFTSAYRNAIVRRDISGITAQLIMIGLAMVMFAPFLASGEAFGRHVSGAVAPAGVRVALGSFVFGLGMQLGSGCGSGTLYTVGGGSTRMIVTLIAFCTGAFLGSLDSLQLPALPSLGAVSFGKALGWPLAIILQTALLAAVWLAFRQWAGTRPQKPIWGEGLNVQTLIHGPWPLLFSAGMLAVLNLLTLFVAGHPWTVTWAFTGPSLYGEQNSLSPWAGNPPRPAFGAAAFRARPSKAAFSETTSR